MMPDAGAQGANAKALHGCFFFCFEPVFCSLLLFMLRPRPTLLEVSMLCLGNSLCSYFLKRALIFPGGGGPHIKQMENIVLPPGFLHLQVLQQCYIDLQVNKS